MLFATQGIAEVRLNGIATGEAGLNALVAQHFGVPVVAITGDQYVGPEVEPFIPGIRRIQVKESISRYAAAHLHPLDARERIADGVRASIESPARIEVDFLSSDMADQATWIRGVTLEGPRTVSVTDDEPLRLFQAFITLVFLTRSTAEAL